MQLQKVISERIFDGFDFLEGYWQLVFDAAGTIVALTPFEEDGYPVILKTDDIICPGFINCHCHLELSHMKQQIPEQTGLPGFLFAVNTQRQAEEAEIIKAASDADIAMYNNGIVAVGDICNTTHPLVIKQQSPIYYHNFIEVFGIDPAVAEKRIAAADTLLHNYRVAFGTQQCTIAPHAPYSISEQLWQLIKIHSGGQLTSLHNQEDPAENLLFKNRTGAFTDFYKKINFNIEQFTAVANSSIEYSLPWFSAQQQVILVHNTTTTGQDIIFCTETSDAVLYWCLCPNANLYITGLLPDVNIFPNDRVVVGTDSLASNHQLSISAELQTLKKHFPELLPKTLLKWGTSNGAKALNCFQQLGSFEKGKQPGIIQLTHNLDMVQRIV